MMEAKKSGAGHRVRRDDASNPLDEQVACAAPCDSRACAPPPTPRQKYKLCRRILQNPVVDVDTYSREIKDGKPHGEGERNAAGEREGFGVMVFVSGDMYEGQWRAGRPEGEGTYHYATGNRYEGQFVAGKREGKGTYHYATGDRYEGEFVAEKREGKGTMHYANGNVYEGEWVAEKREGKGTYHYADGEVEVGRYKGGAGVGEAARWSADRATAWRLSDGKAGKRISLEEAARIAERVGLPVPGAA